MKRNAISIKAKHLQLQQYQLVSEQGDNASPGPFNLVELSALSPT